MNRGWFVLVILSLAQGFAIIFQALIRRISQTDDPWNRGGYWRHLLLQKISLNQFRYTLAIGQTGHVIGLPFERIDRVLDSDAQPAKLDERVIIFCVTHA